MGKRIGFVSTRFAGTDGVTLEASKWASVLAQDGHECFWFAGELDRDPTHAYLVSEAHFKHEQNNWINAQVFDNKWGRSTEITDAIQSLKATLKRRLEEFVDQFNIDILIAENALTIPIHIPLGLALSEFIAETQMPTIAHHHDFFWERTRFAVNGVSDYLHMAFPPTLPSIAHVVINSPAQEELAHRVGVSSIIIPNVLDFAHPPRGHDRATRNFRDSLKLDAEDIIILQPTRIIQRKGIEHAIALVEELGESRYKLLISHAAGDEGFAYAEWLQQNARRRGVDLRTIDVDVGDPFNPHNHSTDRMTLWDIYPHADFITYPSLYEGFGNAFLEAIYFRKPMLVNRYSTFVKDIEPKGFELVVMDGFLTQQNVKHVREVLESTDWCAKMVEKNYMLALQHFSYAVLRRWLNTLMVNVFGV